MRAGDAGVVDEQVDARVALEDARGGGVDRCAVGDVALLVLVGGRRRAAREADARASPARAAARTSAAPMPEEAPVTTATRIGADSSRQRRDRVARAIVRRQARTRPRCRQQALDRVGDRAAAGRRRRAARVHLPGRAHRVERPRARRERRRARSSPSSTSAPTSDVARVFSEVGEAFGGSSTSSCTRSPSPPPRISRAASPTRRATGSGWRSTSAPTRSSRARARPSR